MRSDSALSRHPVDGDLRHERAKRRSDNDKLEATPSGDGIDCDSRHRVWSRTKAETKAKPATASSSAASPETIPAAEANAASTASHPPGSASSAKAPSDARAGPPGASATNAPNSAPYGAPATGKTGSAKEAFSSASNSADAQSPCKADDGALPSADWKPTGLSKPGIARNSSRHAAGQPWTRATENATDSGQTRCRRRSPLQTCPFTIAAPPSNARRRADPTGNHAISIDWIRTICTVRSTLSRYFVKKLPASGLREYLHHYQPDDDQQQLPIRRRALSPTCNELLRTTRPDVG